MLSFLVLELFFIEVENMERVTVLQKEAFLCWYLRGKDYKEKKEPKKISCSNAKEPLKKILLWANGKLFLKSPKRDVIVQVILLLNNVNVEQSKIPKQIGSTDLNKYYKDEVIPFHLNWEKENKWKRVIQPVGKVK